MIISHRYKFIFLKSRKTAGTSTEAFLERYCVSPSKESTYEPQHTNNQQNNEFGVMGYRQKGKGSIAPHTYPSSIKQSVAKNYWDNYTKIINIRNPYDTAVSFYHWKAYRSNTTRQIDTGKFEQWLTQEGSNPVKSNLKFWQFKNIDPNKYIFLRYEHLQEDLNKTLIHLGMPNYNKSLPTYKTNLYDRAPYQKYYNNTSKQFIDRYFGEFMNRFGYTF